MATRNLLRMKPEIIIARSSKRELVVLAIVAPYQDLKTTWRRVAVRVTF